MTTSTLTIGLRFRQRDAGTLLRCAQWMEANGLQREDITLFALAAKAANDGDPLVVHCGDINEAEQMAAGFVLHGVTRPALEHLNT